MLVEREFPLTEILVKTNYQVVIHKEKSFQNTPIAYGSGFFLRYKTELFFITADHNIHIEDHEENERTGVDNYLGIMNNISDKANFSTYITPINGFYYMDSFDISKENLDEQLFDVAISLVDPGKFEAPFLTNETILNGNSQPIVSPNEVKFDFLDEHIINPSKEDTYFIYGQIKPKIQGLYLHRSPEFKSNMKYVSESGNYLLLNTTNEISNYEDWAGLSGSPVINQDGKCVGVMCSVLLGTKAIFVKPFSKLLPILDMILINEKLDI